MREGRNAGRATSRGDGSPPSLREQDAGEDGQQAEHDAGTRAGVPAHVFAGLRTQLPGTPHDPPHRALHARLRPTCAVRRTPDLATRRVERAIDGCMCGGRLCLQLLLKIHFDLLPFTGHHVAILLPPAFGVPARADSYA